MDLASTRAGLAARPPAITGITLISGFATTLTWPAVAWLIEQVGWRYTCIGYAILLVLATPLYLKVLPQVRRLEVRAATTPVDSNGLDRRLYLRLIWIFALGAIIMTAVSVQLVAVLQGLGHSLSGAIALAALLGPS